MKLGVFGGTFDPIHAGHLEIAKAAKQQFLLDQVLFIPNFIPPHKKNRSDVSPAPYRYHMVELALAHQPGMTVCDLEINRPDISYTVDTLRELHSRFPSAEMFLIVGQDAFQEMKTWKEPDVIRKLAKLIVVPRLSKESGALPVGVETVKSNAIPLSSTMLRSKLVHGEPVSADEIPEKVLQYIRRMKLYAGASNAS